MSLTVLREWITRLVWTVRPKRSDADLEQELCLHAELAPRPPGDAATPSCTRWTPCAISVASPGSTISFAT
jgi:hypothetical protein